jgi:hypothetical protein
MIMDAQHIETLSTMMRRNRATITRRRSSLQQALEHQQRYIREALEMGMPPKQVARLTGYTEGRISQIRNQGGSKVSMFNLL